MPSVDILVIGAGPAGATSARILAKNGLSVLLIDQASFPRSKLCGGLLTSKTLDLLRTVYDEDAISDSFETVCGSVTFWYKERPLCSLTTRQPFTFVDRRHFDHLLVQQAIIAGAQFRDGTACRSLDLENRNAVLSDASIVHFRVVIGADGAMSKTRQLVDARYRPDGFCIETEVPVVRRSERQNIEVFFGRIKSGYVWNFPRGDISVRGVGAPMSRNKGKYLEVLRNAFAPCAREKWSPKGALVPFGTYVKRPISDDTLLLVGDAAGLVDPLTGEGIYFAMLSGVYAAEAVGMEPGKSGIGNAYLRKVRRIQRILLTTTIASRIFHSRYVHAPFLLTFGRSATVMRFFCDHLVSSYALFLF